LELTQLKYFLAVTQHGGFSKAAVALSVAQPVLSRQIRSLEQELGMDLLYRNGRGIIVTEAGRLVVEHAQAMVGTECRIATEIDKMRASPSGKLCIGLPPSAAPVLSVPLILRFRESYPDIKLRIQEGFNGHVLEWLSAGRIDVAVLYNAPKTSTLTTQPLIEEELLLIGPRGAAEKLGRDTVSAKDLGDLPLILPSHPHGIRALVESRLNAHQINLHIECEIDSLNTTVQLVEQGVGYTILPYVSVIGKVKTGTLSVFRIGQLRLSRELVLATSTQRPTTLATRSLAKAVTQLVRDLVQKGIWTPKDDIAPMCRAAGGLRSA
jgi:LysR family nitrogen assimilation transcriptional regulator